MKQLSNIGKSFDEVELGELSKQPMDYQASVLDARVIAIERASKRTYSELGLICLYVDEKALYGRLFNSEGKPFRSLNHWLDDRAPFSKSYGYEAMQRLKILRDSGAPIEQVREIPRKNIKTMVKLSPALQRDPKVIEAAKTKSETEFIAHIVEHHPNQHIDQKVAMIFHPDVTVRVKVDEALKLLQQEYECDRNEALGYMADIVLESEEAHAISKNGR